MRVSSRAAHGELEFHRENDGTCTFLLYFHALFIYLYGECDDKRWEMMGFWGTTISHAKPRIPKLGKLRDLTVSKSSPHICAHGRMAHALSPVPSPMETSLQEHSSLIGCFQGFAVGIFRRDICWVTYRLIFWEMLICWSFSRKKDKKGINDFPVQKGTKFRIVLGFWT